IGVVPSYNGGPRNPRANEIVVNSAGKVPNELLRPRAAAERSHSRRGSQPSEKSMETGGRVGGGWNRWRALVDIVRKYFPAGACELSARWHSRFSVSFQAVVTLTRLTC